MACGSTVCPRVPRRIFNGTSGASSTMMLPDRGAKRFLVHRIEVADAAKQYLATARSRQSLDDRCEMMDHPRFFSPPHSSFKRSRSWQHSSCPPAAGAARRGSRMLNVAESSCFAFVMATAKLTSVGGHPAVRRNRTCCPFRQWQAAPIPAGRTKPPAGRLPACPQRFGSSCRRSNIPGR